MLLSFIDFHFSAFLPKLFFAENASLVKLLHLEVGQIAADRQREGATTATGPTTLSQRMSFADSHESSEANNAQCPLYVWNVHTVT